jgi:hypothetical protein
MNHLRYLRYLIRHKWFVLVAGIKIGAPLWRLLTHDLSKFRPGEWWPYLQQFYGTPDEARFNVAWLAHQHRNPHHWQHWILREDSGVTKTLAMPHPFVLEMVADWAGAGRCFKGYWDVAAWYLTSRHEMQLHPETRTLVEAILRLYYDMRDPG